MPLYDYHCSKCFKRQELIVPTSVRDMQFCDCGYMLVRELAAPMGKMAGQVAKGGGADRLVAESLGVKISDLPASLRTPQEACNG